MSARGITGKRRRPKIHPRSAGPGFSLFDSSLTTHPLLLFSSTDFHPRSASYLEVPFIPAFCLVQRIKGTPLPDSDARPANFIMYILPTTGHLCPKKIVESGGHSNGQRMREWSREFPLIIVNSRAL